MGKIGFEIRTRRLRLGLSQEQFSQMLGIGRAHLSDIERDIHRPGPRTRTKIEEILGIADVG